MTTLSNLQNARLLRLALCPAHSRPSISACGRLASYSPIRLSSSQPCPGLEWADLLLPQNSYLNPVATETPQRFLWLSLLHSSLPICSFHFLKQNYFLVHICIDFTYFIHIHITSSSGNVYLHRWDIVNLRSYYGTFKSMVYAGECEFGLAVITFSFNRCVPCIWKEQTS